MIQVTGKRWTVLTNFVKRGGVSRSHIMILEDPWIQYFSIPFLKEALLFFFSFFLFG